MLLLRSVGHILQLRSIGHGKNSIEKLNFITGDRYATICEPKHRVTSVEKTFVPSLIDQIKKKTTVPESKTYPIPHA